MINFFFGFVVGALVTDFAWAHMSGAVKELLQQRRDRIISEVHNR